MSMLQKAMTGNFSVGLQSERDPQEYSSDSDASDSMGDEMHDFGVSFKKGKRAGEEQDMRQNLNKVDNREVKITHSIMNKISASAMKDNQKKIRVKDKEDRATVEQCLDPRTRVILHKMVNKKFLVEINGCLSTGKEANVYHAVGAQGEEYAIKVYKTSILVFKDRERYVAGEFRFRHGHCKSNPRKMIKLWAEKEFRNLKRIATNNKLRCPEAVVVKSNVLVMHFVGKNMECAPKLREVTGGVEYWGQLYLQTVQVIRELYQECRLIHADLSEYNLLVYEGAVWVIDVSQSIEHDHPMAFHFLKRDIYNINNFFTKKKVSSFTCSQLFDYVTGAEEEKEALKDMMDTRHNETEAE